MTVTTIDYSTLKIQELKEELYILKEALKESEQLAANGLSLLVRAISENNISRMKQRIDQVRMYARFRGYESI